MPSFRLQCRPEDWNRFLEKCIGTSRQRPLKKVFVCVQCLTWMPFRDLEKKRFRAWKTLFNPLQATWRASISLIPPLKFANICCVSGLRMERHPSALVAF